MNSHQAKVLGRDESQDIRAQVQEAEIKINAAEVELSKVDYIKVIIFKKFLKFLISEHKFDMKRLVIFNHLNKGKCGTLILTSLLIYTF
jgi:hypothetical protein